MPSPQGNAMSVTEPVTDADGRIDNPRAIRDGFAPEVSVRPLKLHTQMVEGALGGHCFHAEFAKYLASVRPRLVVMWQMRMQFWWASDYGRERVQRAFIQQRGDERGLIAYRSALILCSGMWGSAAYDRLMAETGQSARWIADQGILALKFAQARA